MNSLDEGIENCPNQASDVRYLCIKIPIEICQPIMLTPIKLVLGYYSNSYDTSCFDSRLTRKVKQA